MWKFLLLCVTCFQMASANVGVFYGTGSSIVPFKNEFVQLKSEKVYISFTIPDNSGEFGLTFIPSAHVNATFHLFNHSDHKIPLEIGFPFSQRDTEKIEDFQVDVDGVPQQFELKHGAPEETSKKDFNRIYAWDDTFAPKEKKDITVSYNIKMSVADWPVNEKLGVHGLHYVFPYITGTAYTWKQPVKTAFFKFDLTELVFDLKKMERDSPKYENLLEFYQGRPLTFFYLPRGASYSDRILTMDFKDKVPIGNIEFSLNVILLPATLQEFKTYLKFMAGFYKAATKHSYTSEVKPFNKREILINLLNFYKGLYRGKMQKSLWMTFPKDKLPPKYKEALFKEYDVCLLTNEDREEVGKIISYLEEMLQI